MEMCLYENFMKSLEITMSQPPLPEVEDSQEHEFRNQWHRQISAQANAMPASEKIWPQTPEKGHLNISNQEEFDRQYGQRFEGLKIL